MLVDSAFELRPRRDYKLSMEKQFFGVMSGFPVHGTYTLDSIFLTPSSILTLAALPRDTRIPRSIPA